jgi:hypothetical protein
VFPQSDVLAETVYSSELGIRFASEARIRPDNLLAALGVLREHRSSTILLSMLESAAGDRLYEFYRVAFGEGQDSRSRVNWPALLAHFTPQGVVCVKITGGWDDPEIEVDLFGVGKVLKPAWDSVSLDESSG